MAIQPIAYQKAGRFSSFRKLRKTARRMSGNFSCYTESISLINNRYRILRKSNQIIERFSNFRYDSGLQKAESPEGRRAGNYQNRKIGYLHVNNLSTDMNLATSKKSAFTLTEVLITLGIIGVVAAMTLPVLIQNHRNKVVETRLAKMYSTFNQAVQMSIAENGDISEWYQDLPSFMGDTDENGNPTSQGLQWFNEYIGKYMNIVKTNKYWNANPMFYFADGGSIAMLNKGVSRDWVYFPVSYAGCVKKFGYITSGNNEPVGRCAFFFYFGNTGKGTDYWWSGCPGTGDELFSECKAKGSCCTKLIMENGWKIPKDYPRRISY